MDEIVASVQQVSSLMTSIAADTSAQRIGIDQVNQAIIQIEGGNRQNAALVNREAAAAESLEQESQNLAEAVDVFRLGDAAQTGGGFAKPNVPLPLPHIAHP
jgi:methyl-accepting chemotaxis protein